MGHPIAPGRKVGAMLRPKRFALLWHDNVGLEANCNCRKGSSTVFPLHIPIASAAHAAHALTWLPTTSCDTTAITLPARIKFHAT